MDDCWSLPLYITLDRKAVGDKAIGQWERHLTRRALVLSRRQRAMCLPYIASCSSGWWDPDGWEQITLRGYSGQHITQALKSDRWEVRVGSLLSSSWSCELGSLDTLLTGRPSRGWSQSGERGQSWAEGETHRRGPINGPAVSLSLSVSSAHANICMPLLGSEMGGGLRGWKNQKPLWIILQLLF